MTGLRRRAAYGFAAVVAGPAETGSFWSDGCVTKAHLDASLLGQLAAIDPTEVLEKAAALREQSRKCAELAADCVTPGGRCVLTQMSSELRQEADGLESGLVRMRELLLDLH